MLNFKSKVSDPAHIVDIERKIDVTGSRYKA